MVKKSVGRLSPSTANFQYQALILFELRLGQKIAAVGNHRIFFHNSWEKKYAWKQINCSKIVDIKSCVENMIEKQFC